MDGDVAAAVEAGRRALQLERGGVPSPWRPVGCPVLGLAQHWHGHQADARLTLTEALRIAKAGGNHLAAMHASGGLAAIEYQCGDVVSAQSHSAEALSLAAEHELAEHWASSLALAVRGQLLATAGEVEAADRVVSRAAELARRGIASIEIAFSLLTLASVRRRLGRYEDASRIHAEACDRVAKCADAGILRESVRHAAPAPRASTVRPGLRGDSLSEAELSVLRLLRGDMSQREIATELHLSFNTIKTHTRNIYRKLGVATRAEAIARARELPVL
jgi:LuxR family maltose regulon positive regulatory protein